MEWRRREPSSLPGECVSGLLLTRGFAANELLESSGVGVGPAVGRDDTPPPLYIFRGVDVPEAGRRV